MKLVFYAAAALIISLRVANAFAEDEQVPVTFTGGYETEEPDKGRPVILVAAGLGVPAEVFRDAFSRVKPAPAGERPQPEEVRNNKEALLTKLAPYGVTNERLDEVSNYYRYQRNEGELWRHVPAVAFATVIADALRANNQPVPPAVAGNALIDTGASFCSIDEQVAIGFGLQPSGQIQLGSAGGSNLHNTYVVKISFPEMAITPQNTTLVGCDLVSQNLLFLIGRDLLRNCVLIYNGVLGITTLTF